MLQRLALVCALGLLPATLPAEVTAIRAGRLVDPEAGRATPNAVILVEDGKITAAGANLAVPQVRRGRPTFARSSTILHPARCSGALRP